MGRLDIDVPLTSSVDPIGPVLVTRKWERMDDTVIVQHADFEISVRWRHRSGPPFGGEGMHDVTSKYHESPAVECDRFAQGPLMASFFGPRQRTLVPHGFWPRYLMTRLAFEARYSGARQYIFRIEITVTGSGIRGSSLFRIAGNYLEFPRR